MSDLCARCGKHPVEPGRKKFCSDACADSYSRAQLKLRKAALRATPKRLYRYYPKPEG